ncbi:DUF1707 domain-containing protein [Streptomyces sp. NPDC059002]|uniref:DUF1707 SHOCT-like domain-containing protein n=1 Tax=Streptomyces sp. NPDC059002 TaxID=3346690 RepID=UPI0036BB1F12
MTDVPEDLPQLIDEDERDAAVRRLQEAYAAGRIPHDEMDARLDKVLTAKTQGDLVSAVASLPAEKQGSTSTIGAASGRIKRHGAWQVPQTLKVESAYARVHLDLSQAVIEYPVVDIELQLGTGRAKITVPRDATVDLDGLHTEWKDMRYKAPRRARPGDGPTIRIFGAMGYGRLTVRHARR